VLLGRLRIRGKLALLVTIPLLAVVALAVPIVLGRVDQAKRAADTARTVRVAGQVGVLVQDLQEERLLSIGFLARMVDPSRLQAQVSEVTSRAGNLRATLSGNPQVSKAIDAIQGLSDLRSDLPRGAAPPDKLLAGYNGVIKGLIDSLRLEEGVDVKTPEGRQVTALEASLRTDEGISIAEADLLVAVLAKDPRALVPYLNAVAVVQEQANRITRFATQDQVSLYTKVQNQATAGLGKDFAGAADSDPAASFAKLTPQQVFPALESLVGVGRVVEQRIIDDVTGIVSRQQDRALTTAYVVGGIALLILLVAVFLVLTVGRAVARPLTRLTSSADRVARVAESELTRVADDETESPAPVHLEAIEVTGRDEIGDLARAFERVQGTAARLVERQVASRRNVAQMFGHVGRRTQNLVGRQIALIDRLEREETDPERLQHLYRLDHVSSRLSRNAGSLVVLSGSTGTNEHLNPLMLADVVRLALGEIEDYVRVDVEIPPDLALVPNVINDLVLVFAELMENATVFSPPHTRVTVTAQKTQYGAQVAIVDHGIGLSPERLTEENARLARRERLDLAPTEVLGLFVVGRLARRHGLGVALWPTPGGGLTATVAVSDRLLTTAPAPLPPPEPVRQVEPVRQPEPLRATTPGRPASAPPVPVGAAPVPKALSTIPFDVDALNRANQSIESGGHWNAFIPPQRRVPVDPSLVTAGPAVAAPPLRQRIPGAQLSVESVTTPTLAPTPAEADAVLAQAMVDDFEAGVRRAQRQAVNLPAPALAAPGRPAGGAVPALTRRVPGATLTTADATVPLGTTLTQQPPPSPDEARDLVEQFEAGVSRALRDVRTDQ
jgi:signal transduction histidine kinase